MAYAVRHTLPMTNCQLCKKPARVSEKTMRVELGHEVPYPLTMTVDVCKPCYSKVSTVGLERAKGARLVAIA